MLMPVFGNTALIVRSGSMTPTINVGDLIIARPQKNHYEPGQVIAYDMPGKDKVVVTHRVVDVSFDAKGATYRTKGDANNEADSFNVPEASVLGRNILTIPYVGRVLGFAKTKAGFLSLVLIPAGLVILGEVGVIIREMRRGRKKEKRQARNITRPSAPLMPQPTPAFSISSPPQYFFEPAYRTGKPAFLESAPTARAPKRTQIFVDSVSRRLVMLLAGLAVMLPSTWALYSDTAASTDNIFTTSEDFGVGPGDIVIDEVMWMGTAGNGDDEWLELRNMTSDPIDLTHWEIVNAGSGAGTPVSLSGAVPSNGFWLLSRFVTTSSSVSSSITADQVTSGLSFNNGGEQLTLRNASDVTIDQTPVPPPAWAAGVNSTLKQSMERNDPPSDGTVAGNWHTCTDSGCNDTTYWDTEGNNYGTPKATNL